MLAFVALLYSNWNLRRRYAELSASQHTEQPRTAPSPFLAGEIAPRLHVVDKSGHPFVLDPAAWPRESFLLFALPGCAACRLELVNAAKAGNVNFTVVSLASKEVGESILKEIPSGVSVYFLDHTEIPRLRQRIDSVPRVLRVSPGGKIIAVCGSMTNCGPSPSPACPTCSL